MAEVDREKLVEVIRNALWRQMFAGDEDAETVEYQKQVWDYDWDRTLQKALDLLSAIEAAGVRLVPVEATEKMIGEAFMAPEARTPAGTLVHQYRYMLAASPFAPEGK